MNRVIKFRAWDKHNKEMAKVDHWLFNNDEIFASNNLGEPKMTYHYEIMQFTGLHDKNGKEIFEGDIVTGWTAANEIIAWNDHKARFDPKWLQLWKVHVRNTKLEIIGNIHENKDLLK